MIVALFVEYRTQVQHLLFLGLALLAWARGDAPEKRVGAILLGMVLLDYLYHWIFGQRGTYRSIHIGHLMIDVLALATLIPVSMRANRIYPLWVTAAQLISVMSHFNRLIAPGLPAMAYWILPRAPSYVQLIAFALGLGMHLRRIRHGKSFPPWRTS